MAWACERCMWFHVVRRKGEQYETENFLPLPGESGTLTHVADRTTGSCRAMAPAVGGFPMMNGDDWCGNFYASPVSATEPEPKP